ncbi:MAG: hypothetical protein ACYS0G_16640 [Planctomycetota bacterium]|jgi:hypothetical protein
MTRHTLLASLMALGLVAPAACRRGSDSLETPDKPQPEALAETMPTPPSDHNVLDTSDDGRTLLKAALPLARSAEAADHERLLAHLTSAGFLKRLDTEEEYDAAASQRLKISRLVEALGHNDAPSARATLVALSENPTFLDDEERIDILIQNTVEVRPAPPTLVKFWADHCRPDDGYTPLTVATLVENGTEDALRLLERTLADPAHQHEEKIAWMRTDILEHRNDVALLESCERMLRTSLPANLRPQLVEVLFDYKPAVWYRPAVVSTPPSRREASPEARERLRTIGRLALDNVELTDEQRKAVESVLEQLKT